MKRSNMETNWLMVVLLLSTGVAVDAVDVSTQAPAEPTVKTVTQIVTDAITTEDVTTVVDGTTLDPTTPDRTTPDPTTIVQTTPDVTTVVDGTTPDPTTPDPTTIVQTTPVFTSDVQLTTESTFTTENPQTRRIDSTTPDPTTPDPTTPAPTTPDPTTIVQTTPDIQAPNITCGMDVSQSTDTGVSTAVVSYTIPTATDSDLDEVICKPEPNTTFEVGITTVVCNATDTSGNVGTCSFIVSITDNEPPVVTCPEGGTYSTDAGKPYATVSWDPLIVTDNVDSNLEATCNPASGTQLGTGLIPITCSTTDTAGNIGSCDFTVIVEDNEKPVVTCPSNETYSTDAGQKYATVNWTDPIVTDNVDDNLQATCDPPSGSPLETSPFPITCRATDTAGNEGSCKFTVIIEDNEAPVLDCPVNQDLPTDTGKKVATYNADVTATDNVDGAKTTTCIPAGNIFEIGNTNVSCSATDTKGNTGNCIFSVTVSDQEKPTFSNCMAQSFNLLLDADNTTVVNYTTPNVTDNVKVVSGPECNPASGSRFLKGSTPVTCTASDAANNVGECLFDVTLINCELGTYGENCMGCTCVDNSLCEPTTGNCPGCVDETYGFKCNFRDLRIEINDTDLSVLDGNVTQHIGKVVELNCIYNLLNISGQWSKDGIILVEFTGDTTGMATYNLPDVGFDDIGTYTCTVNPLQYTDRISNVSKSVVVNVEVPPEFKIRPQDQQGTLLDNLTFTCSASGRPEVEITWLDNTGNAIGITEGKYQISEIATEDNMIFTTNSTLVVYNISRDDNGAYECQVTNNLVNMVDPLVESFDITVQEKPDAVKMLRATTVTARTITVVWTRGDERNSEIEDCTVTYMEQGGSESQSEKAENEGSHTIENLDPYVMYTIDVFCTNDIGDSDKATISRRTNEDAPTAPREVDTEYIPTNEICKVTWVAPETLNGVIRSYTVKYSVAPVGGIIESDNNMLEHTDLMNLALDIRDTAAYSVYTITVFGTTVSPGPESLAVTCETPATGPEVIPAPGPATNPEITHNSFQITLEEPIQRNGPVSCYAVIVVQVKVGEMLDGKDPGAEYPEKKIVSYDQAKDQQYVPYVAVAFEHKDFKETITIGSGERSSCQPTALRGRRAASEYPHDGVNGELNSDSTYTVFLRAYVSENVHSSSAFLEPVKTEKNNTAVNVVIAIIVILLVVVVVLLLVSMHRRYDLRDRFFRRRQPYDGPLQLESRDNTGYLQEYPAISIERLHATFQEKHMDSDKLFNMEYKSLPASSRAITTEASSIAENKGKNRYINILAYDQSRVILTEIDGEPGSDYINACYVDGYEMNNKFIAAQGPKEETVVDFWRMIWEQRSPAIVMLTKTFEKGREKCAQYWPDSDSQEFDQFTITLEDTVKTCEYVIRRFRVQNSDVDEDARCIHQYHFIGWPDFGIPDYPYTMLCFIKRIRQMVPKPMLNGEVGPLTVHCSAGVGRTGTYIVIDVMLDQMVAEKQVDIYNFVSKIRGQRNLLVQSQVQYVFIHQALLEEYQYKDSEIDVTSMQQKWSELIQKQPDSDFSNLELEFRRVTQIHTPHLTQKDGTMEPNKIKNRLLQVIPYDANRVKLQRLIGKEHSDYINASYIDGYEYKSMYIATQGPTKETIGDFWRMVWDERTSCIIMMTDLEENGQEKCCQYWPEDNTPVVHDTIAVQVKEQRDIEGSEYIVREFQVTNTKGGESRTVFQYHYVGWPHSGVPNSGTGLVDLIGKVHKYQESIHSTFPIVVHCSGGAGRTGVFIALSVMLERVKAEGLIDVFQTVRTLRQQRPHMVQNFEQYGFCYHAVREYMDSFDHYANLK